MTFFEDISDGFGNLFNLGKTIGQGWGAQPDDVVKTKTALQGLGYYNDDTAKRYETEGKPFTDMAGTKLFDDLKKFQKDNGLRADGIMNPNGPTHKQMVTNLGERANAVETSPFDQKPSFPATGLEAAPTPKAKPKISKQSLWKDAQEGKPGTLGQIMEHKEQEKQERLQPKNQFKTLKKNPLTGMMEKVKPPKKAKPPLSLAQPSLLKPQPKSKQLEAFAKTPAYTQMQTMFTDLLNGKDTFPKANINNVPGLGAKKKPEAQAMDYKLGRDDQEKPQSMFHQMKSEKEEDNITFAKNAEASRTERLEGGSRDDDLYSEKITPQDNIKQSVATNSGKEKGYVSPISENYRHKLFERESRGSGGYKALHRNENGEPDAIGRYQFRYTALKDIGMVDADNKWTGKHGVKSLKDFLESPEAQEKALGGYFAKMERYVKSVGGFEAIGQSAEGR